MDIDKGIAEIAAEVSKALDNFWDNFQAERNIRAFDCLGSARFALGSWYGLLLVKGGISLVVGDQAFSDAWKRFEQFNYMMRDIVPEGDGD